METIYHLADRQHFWIRIPGYSDPAITLSQYTAWIPEFSVDHSPSDQYCTMVSLASLPSNHFFMDICSSIGIVISHIDG